MKKSKLIAIETTRYSEFFRQLFQEYGTDSQAKIDGKIIDATQFLELIANWCTNEQIKKTKDFKLSRGKTDLFGFHDSPNELWAVESELPFIEKLAADKLVRFRIMKCRAN
ncbi:MAG: hypothetical protein QOD03_722 [Verrucomicrobiota bacterium]|jgi:hypothetical protein